MKHTTKLLFFTVMLCAMNAANAMSLRNYYSKQIIIKHNNCNTTYIIAPNETIHNMRRILELDPDGNFYFNGRMLNDDTLQELDDEARIEFFAHDEPCPYRNIPSGNLFAERAQEFDEPGPGPAPASASFFGNVKKYAGKLYAQFPNHCRGICAGVILSTAAIIYALWPTKKKQTPVNWETAMNPAFNNLNE